MSEIDHTGKIVCGKTRPLSYSEWRKQMDRVQGLIAEEERRRNIASKGKLTFCLVSRNHGHDWTKVVLCEKCIKDLEPPVRVRRQGATGASRCDWCETYNEDF